MKKIILFIILFILFISFGALILNAYILQKNYFNSKKAVVIDDVKNEEVNNVTPSVYKSYSKDDYDIALKEKRVILLFFTSNWCKECSKQNDLNNEAFSELKDLGTLGLNIHILDSETTTETDALAKKFGVTKENTFVILDKNGAVSFKFTGELSKDGLISKIKEVTSK